MYAIRSYYDFGGVDEAAVVDLRRHLGKLRDADDEGERCVLDERHELVDERRDHVPQSLRQDDVTHGLLVAETRGSYNFV